MGKGSTKGWTYASEQWRIEPFFENDALDLKIAVKEIVDGEISEVYANGMSFSVGYEAVTEPGTPQTGDSSMMVLWIALLDRIVRCFRRRRNLLYLIGRRQ